MCSSDLCDPLLKKLTPWLPRSGEFLMMNDRSTLRQNLGDDERPFPGRREFVPPSGVLSQPKHQVAHLEVSGPNPSGMVASQGLLVPRRV